MGYYNTYPLGLSPEKSQLCFCFQGDELSSNEMVSHRVPHQFGITLRAEDIHNPVFMEGYSSGRQIQGVSNFLHDFSFG